jgi:hypothetical protein
MLCMVYKVRTDLAAAAADNTAEVPCLSVACVIRDCYAFYESISFFFYRLMRI